jgi:hypothetical protein
MTVRCARVLMNFSIDVEENVAKIVYCQVDTDRTKALRDGWEFFRDRRSEVYAAVAAP